MCPGRLETTGGNQALGWGKGAIFGDFHGENDEKFQKPLEVDADFQINI
jgi:hypothetical protein